MSNGREIRPQEIEPVVKGPFVVAFGEGDFLVFADGRHQQHVRRWSVEIKIFSDILLQIRWCKRSKSFSILDLEIEFLLHFRIARIAEDTAISQCARAEFHAALKPTDNISICELGRHVRS